MAHLYKADIWKDNGVWHVNDVQDLAGISGYWWVPMRMLELSPIEYVTLLKEKFNASNFIYTAKYDTLIFSFKKESDGRKFKNYINKIARDKNFIV